MHRTESPVAAGRERSVVSHPIDVACADERLTTREVRAGVARATNMRLADSWKKVENMMNGEGQLSVRNEDESEREKSGESSRAVGWTIRLVGLRGWSASVRL